MWFYRGWISSWENVHPGSDIGGMARGEITLVTPSEILSWSPNSTKDLLLNIQSRLKPAHTEACKRGANGNN